MKPILEIADVSKYFGGLVAVKNMTFHVKEGEILGLIGPNGAGKTTLFNVICGIYRPNTGAVRFMGEDVTGLKPHKICKRGIGRTFQIAKYFPHITALENVITGSLFGGGLTDLEDAREEALKLIDFVGLSEKREVLAKDLIYQELKLMGTATALATKPKLLLMDEAAAGLRPMEIGYMKKLIGDIRDNGITVMVVEHVMKLVMGVCERIIVMHYGEKIAEGSPQEVSKNRKVVQAYLGGRYRA